MLAHGDAHHDLAVDGQSAHRREHGDRQSGRPRDGSADRPRVAAGAELAHPGGVQQPGGAGAEGEQRVEVPRGEERCPGEVAERRRHREAEQFPGRGERAAGRGGRGTGEADGQTRRRAHQQHLAAHEPQERSPAARGERGEGAAAVPPAARAQDEQRAELHGDQHAVRGGEERAPGRQAHDGADRAARGDGEEGAACQDAEAPGRDGKAVLAARRGHDEEREAAGPQRHPGDVQGEGGDGGVVVRRAGGVPGERGRQDAGDGEREDGPRPADRGDAESRGGDERGHAGGGRGGVGGHAGDRKPPVREGAGARDPRNRPRPAAEHPQAAGGDGDCEQAGPGDDGRRAWGATQVSGHDGTSAAGPPGRRRPGRHRPGRLRRARRRRRVRGVRSGSPSARRRPGRPGRRSCRRGR